MTLTIVSYTGRSGTADTTINDNSHYTCRLANDSIVKGGDPFYTERGDGQQPVLGGVRLKGNRLRLNVTIRSGTTSDGMKFWAGLFEPSDTSTKTLVFTDGTRQWQVTGRNNGIGPHLGGGNFQAEMLLDTNVLYTVATTTETTFAVVADGQTQDFTLSIGNIDAYPVYDIIPQGVGGSGQRYRRFLTTYNYTKRAAIAYHIDVTGGGLNTAALVNFTAISLQVNNGAGYNSSATTIAYDTVTGTLPAVPFMLYRGGEQMRVTAQTGTTSGNLTVVRGVHGSVATSHADNAVLALSKMAFDGRDIRLLSGDGNGGIREIPYFFGDSGTAVFNNTATKIWAPLDYIARIDGTLANAITDVATSLTLTYGYGVPTSNGLFLIDSEIMSFGSFDIATATTPDLLRGAKGTTAAAHSAGATVRVLNETWLYYGSATATAPNYTVSPYIELKPIFNLGTSTNSSWVYSNYASKIQNTRNEWVPQKQGTGIVYTSDRDINNVAGVDPVAEIGISTLNRSDYAAWLVNIAFGYTSVTFTNVDRWNLPAATAYVSDNTNAVGVNTAVAANTSVSTWQTTASLVLTSASVSFVARLWMRNNSSANYARRAGVNVESATVALSTATTSDTNGVPFVSLGSELDVTYDLDARLENSTTTDSLSFKFDNMAVGSILRIDTLRKTITYVTDGRRTNPLPYKARENWLRLPQGTSTLRFWGWHDATINVIVKYQGRSDTFA